MSKLTITDQRLKPIAERVLAGVRLTVQDGIALYRSPDLLAGGWLADHVRGERDGNRTHLNVNRHSTTTNTFLSTPNIFALCPNPTSPPPHPLPLDEHYT